MYQTLWGYSRSLGALALMVWGLSGCALTPVASVASTDASKVSSGLQTDSDAAAANNVPPVTTRPPKLGLALGGGAARGFAHVGVIQVLEEAGLRPDVITGTSAGSMVAALYASGRNAAQLQKIAETMDEATFTDWTMPFFSNRGMLRGEALARYVQQQVSGRRIEEMSIPLGIVATDLQNGSGVLFERGDIGTAVRASSAVPGVFQPVRISGRDYVDGGLVSPVPVRQARQMGAELVIAVDISQAPEANSASDVIQILLQTFSIMGKTINSLELKGPDLVVVRPGLRGISGTDFAARNRAIQAGRLAMQQALPQLRAALEQGKKQLASTP